MTIKIYVGDTDETLATAAVASDPTAFLVDSNNYQEFLNKTFNDNITVYTSLGDLPKNLEVFYNILMRADQIIYCPPPTWSDSKKLNLLYPTLSVQGLTENILLLIADLIPVTNIELAYLKKNPVQLVDVRKSNTKQLWCVGPSIVEGNSIDINLRFGTLLANELKLPCSFLTKEGSSNMWGADQILKSDILPGDIVIWGLTITKRLQLIFKGKDWGIHSGLYKDHPFLEDLLPSKQLHSENTFYQNINAIEQVINFCKKCQAKLILFSVLGLPQPDFLRYLRTKTNYIHFPYNLEFSISNITAKYTDYGIDNDHPGPEQHQLFAKFLLKHIQAT